tara:strand:+ start:537 stop:1964 length:1428 start_codon:yes stop_codon:yes gene_type:complete
MENQRSMEEVLKLQREHYLKEGPPSYELRIDRLNRVQDMVIKNKDRIIEAVNADFGSRSPNQSLISDVYAVLPAFTHAKKHLKSWMKDEKRKSNFPFGLMGAKSYIHREPLGVIGMISPWNFPMYLSLAPLAGIFSAGNQVMHKPSEFTPITSELLKEICDGTFDETEFATFLGGPDVGSAFTQLKFDHLLFTGSGNIGKHVMRAASENLVPLTLELGGKSPVIVSDSSNINITARRVMFNKTLNAGQICLAPDYVYVHESEKDNFVEACKDQVSNFYSDLKYNPDYTSVINQKHYDRLNGLLSDAKDHGAELVEINPADEDFTQQESHKIPPTLVLNPTDEMQIMKEEIFGPLLPIKTYKDISEPINYINKNDKPLGLYYFGNNKNEEVKVVNSTSSGGVTVNDIMGHIQQNELGFGGVGPSGMGKYDGFDGFTNFSNNKPIYKQVGFILDILLDAIRPPYKGSIEEVLKKLLK